MESKWRVIFFLDYYLEDNKKKTEEEISTMAQN